MRSLLRLFLLFLSSANKSAVVVLSFIKNYNFLNKMLEVYPEKLGSCREIACEAPFGLSRNPTSFTRSNAMGSSSLNRREFLRWTGVLAGLGTLSACVPSASAPMAEQTAPEAAGGITRGGTLIHSYTSGLGTMDPQFTQSINHVFTMPCTTGWCGWNWKIPKPGNSR